MANYKGNHSQLKKFKKGHPGNPKGRPKIPDDLKRIRKKYSKEVIQGMIAKCLDISVSKLEDILKNKENKIIDHLIGRVVLMGIVHGDHTRLNFILDRLIGKVTDKLEFEGKEEIIFRARIGESGALIREVIDATPESDAETIKLLGEVNKHGTEDEGQAIHEEASTDPCDEMDRGKSE